MIPSPLLESVLNRYLQLDPEVGKSLAELEGKVITLKLATFTYQLRFRQQKLYLASHEELKPDLTISGSPLTFLSLALSRDKKAAFLRGELALEGDAELGQQVFELFVQLEIDWEELLSRWIGDLPAHELGRRARGILGWSKEAGERLLQSVNEYIHEEKPWFPPATLMGEFLQEVDELRLSTDRLEARIKQLKGELLC